MQAAKHASRKEDDAWRVGGRTDKPPYFGSPPPALKDACPQSLILTQIWAISNYRPFIETHRLNDLAVGDGEDGKVDGNLPGGAIGR